MSLFYIILFIFVYVGSSVFCTRFLKLKQVEIALYYGAGSSQCCDFSHCRTQALGMGASVTAVCRIGSCSSWDLEQGVHSCGLWA